jgi:hypothetical protein
VGYVSGNAGWGIGLFVKSIIIKNIVHRNISVLIFHMNRMLKIGRAPINHDGRIYAASIGENG